LAASPSDQGLAQAGYPLIFFVFRTPEDEQEFLLIGILDHRGRLVVDGERAENLPGLLRCYFGCATFLSGEPEGDFLLRIDPLRRRVAMWPLIDPKSTLPRIDVSVRVDLRRQDVNVRPDPRRLLRKGELLGLSVRSKQRRAETGYRVERAFPEDAVFERLEPALPTRATS
jgi:hypothetical protein